MKAFRYRLKCHHYFHESAELSLTPLFKNETDYHLASAHGYAAQLRRAQEKQPMACRLDDHRGNRLRHWVRALHIWM